MNDIRYGQKTGSPGLVQQCGGIFRQRRLEGIQNRAGYPEGLSKSPVPLYLSADFVAVEAVLVSTETGEGDATERDRVPTL